MLGILNKPSVSKNKKILPYEKFGLKSMSIGNMVPQDGSVIWRGAMASNAIRQLVNDVEWGDLDYLLIDLPPGTGDIQLSLCQNFSILGAVIVSTPQEISLLDVRKAISMFKKVNVNIVGMIQNMSYFENAGEKNYIFGKDGVKKESEKQSYKFWERYLYLRVFQALVIMENLYHIKMKQFFSMFLIKFHRIF